MSSTTLEVLLQQFIEEYELGGHPLGRIGDATAPGSTTTIVDLTRFGGPRSGAEFPNLSPIRITSGLRIGENTWRTDLDPSTGTFTVLPALTGALVNGDNFIVVRGDVVEHIDRLIESLNRGLNRDCHRRMKVPLTYVPNGDYLAAAATTGWTATNAAAAYVDLAHPDGYYQRVLQNTASAANGRLQSATLKARPGETWLLRTWVRVTTPGDIAELVIQNETAGTVIVPTYKVGAATTSSLAFVVIDLEFVIPAGSTQISIRLQSSANGDVSQWGPVIAAPRDAVGYAGQTHFEHPAKLGDWYTLSSWQSPAGPEEDAFRQVHLANGQEQYGWGIGLEFDAVPPFPLYNEMLLSYADLSADTDTTACPEDLALAAMAYQFFWPKRTRGPEWLDLARDSDRKLRDAQRRWGAERKLVVRREYAGAASA